jgi:hypothetical protein
MFIDKVNDGKGGEYTIVGHDDFELQDPLLHYKTAFLRSGFQMRKDLVDLKKLPFPEHIMNKVILDAVIKHWNEQLENWKKVIIPESFLKLLEGNLKKREQEKLLRGANITPNQLMAFLITAGEKGFLFSQYRGEHKPNSLNITQLPNVIHLDKDEIKTVGETSLTDGQLKQVLSHRSVTIAKFLDKEQEWHCFFITYDSIGGKEKWKNGQPHYHYISDKWGIPREDVVKQLKSKTYSLPSLPHIDLLEYGNQVND